MAAVQGLVARKLGLVLEKALPQGLGAEKLSLVLAESCFQGLEVSICFMLISMQQSLQKNHAIFLQGSLYLYKNAVFEPIIGILAEKRGISSARICAASQCAISVLYLAAGSHWLIAKRFQFPDALPVVTELLEDSFVVEGDA